VRTRVYVLVVDGCSPREITATLMPNLAALRDTGTNYPAAQSLPVMETIPNHVMMMTGVRPDRSGVPANSVYDRTERVVRTLDRPSDLRFPTLLERLQARGFSTGTVLSKEYLFGIFGTRATYRWEPAPIVPVSGHAPDQFTTDALIAMVDGADPDLVFANFGDIDRYGHSDPTGPYDVDALRTSALAQADLQIGRFLAHLRSTGKWSSSVVLVLADHSMDWSPPTGAITLSSAVAADPLLKGNVVIAQNGGAELVSWIGPEEGRAAGLARMRTLAAAQPGVLSTHEPAELRLGANAGDLLLYARTGWRFSDTTALSNPLPGNHGHPTTLPIPFFVGGGSDRVRRAASSPAAARTIDVAPTVGSLFGLSAPPGGYDGTNRSDAFVSPVRSKG
jgi:arylsulfatase A-like enzyme